MPNWFRSMSIALLVCETLVAKDWPQFRGPSADGVSDAAGLPIHWTATSHVIWKQPIPGSGWSSPVLWDGRLYLTTAVTDASTGEVSLRVLGLDASDGEILWDVEALRPDREAAERVHSKNGLASPTPIIDDERLYVHFGHLGTAALDLDGNIVWRQTTVNYAPRHGSGGSPVLVDDLLVFSCDGEADPFVIALDRSTGDVRWKSKRDTPTVKKFSFSTPIVIEVDGKTQIISPGSGYVGAYIPEDGREIWRVNYGDGYSVVPRPVFAHGLVFVISGYDRPRLLAINPEKAAGDVTETHVVWSREKGVSLTPSALIAGDELYFVSDNGIASCLDARTGDVHWTERLGGDFSASPVLAEGRIYFQNEAGVTFVVKASKSFELLASNDLAERTFASPALSDNALFVRSESHLWRLGE